MRNKPDKQYSPDTPKNSNMTLYEMAVSMSEDGDAQAAFPYLITWLLKDFWSNYQYNGIKYTDEYAYNVAYFLVYNFINRETCSSKPEVFRTKLLAQLVNMNLDHDFNKILQDLKDATVNLTRDEKVKDTKNIDKTSTTTNNLQTKQTGTNTVDGTNVLTHNITSTNTLATKDETTFNDTNTQSATSNGTGSSTNSTSGTNESTSNNTSNSSGRTVNSDYPQSTVDTTKPLDWDYASGAQDTSNTSTDTSTSKDTTSSNSTSSSTSENTASGSNKHTGTNTLDRTGTVTDTKTGTDTTKDDSTVTTDMTTANTGTTTLDDNISSVGDINRLETWSSMSGIELNNLQLDIYNKYGSFYRRLINKLENCFISVYIDDDRDGYLDPSVNLMSAWL